MRAFRTIKGYVRKPTVHGTFEITMIDLPLRCSFKPSGKSVKSKYGYVGSKKDVKILDAWYNWEYGQPMPKILKQRISK